MRKRFVVRRTGSLTTLRGWYVQDRILGYATDIFTSRAIADRVCRQMNDAAREVAW